MIMFNLLECRQWVAWCVRITLVAEKIILRGQLDSEALFVGGVLSDLVSAFTTYYSGSTVTKLKI